MATLGMTGCGRLGFELGTDMPDGAVPPDAGTANDADGMAPDADAMPRDAGFPDDATGLDVGVGDGSVPGTTIVVGEPAILDSAGTTTSIPHPLASGDNRLVLVGANLQAERTHAFTSITYGGVEMSRFDPPADNLYGIGAGGTGCHGELWFLLDEQLPAPSGTYSVSITQSSGNAIAVWVLAFHGVDQADPFGEITTLDNDPISLDVPSAPGELVVDNLCIGNAALPAAGPGQTRRAVVAEGTDVRAFASTEPGSAVTNMSWSVGTSGGITQIAVSLRPANP